MEETYILDYLNEIIYFYWSGAELTISSLSHYFKIKELFDEELKCKIVFAFSTKAKTVKLLNKNDYMKLWKSSHHSIARFGYVDKLAQIEKEVQDA